MTAYSAARRVARAALAACFFTLIGAVAGAQTVTGTIFGKVTDTSSAVLPGATVTLASPQLIGGGQTRVTGEDGGYRVPALPPGRYQVDVELPGFRHVTRPDVQVEAGASVAVDMKLEVAAVSETVTVSGSSSLVDVKSSQTREMATKDLIENVPTGRSFTDVFNLMPGVVNGNYSVATTGTNSVHGGSVRNNAFTVDGANVNDPLVSYPGTDVNLETIEEVQITTSGMSAEFGGASGAVFNVITKSGSNTLAGQANGYFRDKSLQASNVTPELIAAGIKGTTQLTRGSEGGGSLGGPIMRDRLWYFGNYQRIDQTSTVINFPSPVDASQDAYFAKVTAQASTRSRIDAFYQYRLRYDYPFIPDVNTQDPKVWRQQRQSNHTTNVKWTGTLSDRTFVEARASIANQRRFTDFSNAGPDDLGYIDSSTGITSGGWYRELARPGNRNSRQVKADLTHFASHWGPGTHELKTGVSYDWLIDQEVREWLAGARVQLLFNGAPDRIQLSNAPVDQNGRVNQLGLYAQDQWSVTNRLTLNLGVRFESIEGWYPAGGVGGVNFERSEFPVQRDVISYKNAAPRLGFVYDLFGDRKSVIRGSYGRYYNQVYTDEFAAAVPYAFGSKIYQWNDLNHDLVWQPGEEGALISNSTVPALGKIDPDVQQSYVNSGTIGFERELTPTLSVGASVIIKNEHNLAETINAALPFDTAFVPVTLKNPLDGSPITVYAQDPATRGIPTVRLYTNPGTETCSFCPDLTRKYRGLELTAHRRMSNHWQFFASYVYEKNYGTKGTGHAESQANVFAGPNTVVNADGRLTEDRPHQFKAQGSYELPYGVMASASYSLLSGLPWARQIRYLRTDSPQIIVESSITVLGEPIGTQRFDAVQDLSLRGEKRIKLGRSTLGLIVDVFNVMNLSTVTSLQQIRVDHPDFGKPGEILTPRTFRFGARLSF
jgi:outer membrane receptor protein involved in Fe transport